MITARSYQTECVSCIWDYFRHSEGNPVCALPTGTGKSVVIAMFLESVFNVFPNQKIMVLTHVKELIDQNFKKFLHLWPGAPAGIYSAGLNRRDVLQKVIFAGIASVAKRPQLFGHVDLIIVDECHLVSPTEITMYQAFFNFLREVNPHLKIIGFTATPWRLGHGRITDEGGIFTDTCFDITGLQSFNRLIAEGYIAPLIPKKTMTQLDTDGVHIRGGEFIAGELQQAVDKEHITRAAIMEALEYKDSRKSWLVFASGVDHAIHTADIMNEYGIRSVAIHSKMTVDERDKALKGLKSGYYQAAVNNNILTTGFDHPPIDLILGLRPTQSTVLWVQMLGRGTRPYDPNKMNMNIPAERALAEAFPNVKENCLVLDFAANTRRLGPINDPVVPRKKGQGGGEAPVKECPKCGCYMHASVRWCTGVKQNGDACDHEFIFEVKLKQGASTEELIKGDLPVVEAFKVDHINYSRHLKVGRPDSMKVTYYCGYRSFTEYVCVEHGPPAGNKAKGWMRQRLDGVVMETTTSLLDIATELKAPTHIRVWVNQKYPQVLAHCFDGSEFGKHPPGTTMTPSSETDGSSHFLRNMQTQDNDVHQNDFSDDDIPF